MSGNLGGPPTSAEVAQIDHVLAGRSCYGGRYRNNLWILYCIRLFSSRGQDWPVTPPGRWPSLPHSLEVDPIPSPASHFLTPLPEPGFYPPQYDHQVTPNMKIGSPPCPNLPCLVVSPWPGKYLSPGVKSTGPPRHLFDTSTGSPLFSAACMTRVLNDLRIMKETHAQYVEATALPTSAYADSCSQDAADLALINLWITNHLFPSTAHGHLSHL